MNRIYFFTGTGNSLHIAMIIANKLQDCELVAIHKNMNLELPIGYERIDFVFPTYGWALPNMVTNFFRNAQFPQQNGTYFFAVTTCGGLAVNAIPQTNVLLKEQGIILNYGNKVRMFKNSVINYNMSQHVDKIAAESDKRAIPVIDDIVNKRSVKIASVNQFLFKLHLGFMKNINETAQSFNLNESCVSCGICKSVWPADNIALIDGKPVFGHQCEGCVACIQHCPQKALNYKDKTQSRGRYQHPQISAKEIAYFYKF